MRRAFLIGATGQVGGYLLRELRAHPAPQALELHVAARSEQAAAKARAAGATPVHFDLDGAADFDAAFRGCDLVFLLPPYSLGQMMQSKRVVDAARRSGVAHLVNVSAYGGSTDTPHPIIGWNHLVDAYIERSGMAWTHLRPNFFMENLRVQRDAASGEIRNRLGAPVSWVSARDIAAVAAEVLRQPAAHEAQTLDLAVDRRSVVEIAALFERATGRPHRAAPPSQEQMLERLMRAGRERAYAQPLVEYVDAINAGRVPGIDAIFDTVERITGRPGLRWEEFIALDP